jgi:hypothetical protein
MARCCWKSQTPHTPTGLFGIGHHEFFTDNALIAGTRVDFFTATNARGDFNGDGVIALNDFQGLQFCFAGPTTAYGVLDLCRNSDGDGDGDVDVRDAAWLQRSYGLAASVD